MPPRLLLGSHMSVAGGLHTAFERGTRAGCTTMQVFVKNNNRWEGKPLSAGDVQSYKSASAQATIAPVVAHAAYLINLCAIRRDVLLRSRHAFQDELKRCDALGILGLVVHPGSHMGAGESEGIKRIAASLDHIHAHTPGCAALSILEGTAGQGTALGFRFEHLRAIIDLVSEPRRLAVCLDTCHLFAAGYPIHTQEGWDTTLREFESIVGLERLAVIHVNDSQREHGSRIDRHEHIGKGMIGLSAFRMLMNDPRLAGIPKILETEKSEDLHEDIENMTLLRSLLHTGEVTAAIPPPGPS